MGNNTPQVSANIKVDLNQIESMKCGCGNKTFIRVSELKFISAFYTQTGHPEGMGLTQYVCLNPLCGLMFPAVLEQAEVKKLSKNVNAPRFEWGRFFINGIAVAQQTVDAIKEEKEKDA